MTYVVTEACIDCKYTDCVEVCPTDAFREGPNFLAIDPDDCIDCTLCVPECPVEAIYPEEELPEGMRAFIPLNAELAARWRIIRVKKEPLAASEECAKLKHKVPLLQRDWPPGNED